MAGRQLKLWRARSRLYRLQLLYPTAHFSVFGGLQDWHSFPPLDTQKFRKFSLQNTDKLIVDLADRQQNENGPPSPHTSSQGNLKYLRYPTNRTTNNKNSNSFTLPHTQSWLTLGPGRTARRRERRRQRSSRAPAGRFLAEIIAKNLSFYHSWQIFGWSHRLLRWTSIFFSNLVLLASLASASRGRSVPDTDELRIFSPSYCPELFAVQDSNAKNGLRQVSNSESFTHYPNLHAYVHFESNFLLYPRQISLEVQ